MRDADTYPPEPVEQGLVVQRRTPCSACKLNSQVAWCVSADLSVDEQHVGTLCVMRNGGRSSFGLDQMRSLQLFASWAAIAISNAQKVSEARERARSERERIATHLHDHAAQGLGLIGLKLEQLGEYLAAAGQVDGWEQLAIARALTQDILQQVRAAFGELRPQTPADEDLVSALARCVDTFRETSQLPVEFTVTGPCSLPPDLQIQTLHIVREALVNVRRHAQAQYVQVHVVGDAHGVRIIVQDDGTGFDVTQIGKDRHHLGMTIMQERAQRSGGNLTIKTSPGHGTQVVLGFRLQRP